MKSIGYRLIVAAGCALFAAGAGAAGLDAEFLAARDAARTGDGRRLEQLEPRFQGHLLEPYVQYWRLKTGLEARSPEEIRPWLAAHRDTPLSEYLRRDWLKLLGKSGQWELFNAEMPALVNEDLELTCYALQARTRQVATRLSSVAGGAGFAFAILVAKPLG